MCGRYSQTASLSELVTRFGLKSSPLELKPRYNIAPSQEAPVVVLDQAKTLALFRWGLIPSWAKDPAIGHKLINARAETLDEKPSFKKPFRARRCLVLADGFYEWRHDPGGKTKTPLRITLKTREPFAMAGLWEQWKGPDGPVRTFTIVTTSANESLKPIHERMPVIFPRGFEDDWLDPKAEPESLKRLLLPCPDGLVSSYEVSTLVNSPKNDIPAVIAEARR